MKDRTCKTCKKTKPLTDFYSDKKWYRTVCKECDRPIVRERKRKSYNPEKDKVKQAKRQLTGKKADSNERMYKKYPEKWAARAKLNKAIKAGKIIKPTECHSTMFNKCGGKIEAHHFNGYEGENWKVVQWLCKTHHMFLHRKPLPEKEEE